VHHDRHLIIFTLRAGLEQDLARGGAVLERVGDQVLDQLRVAVGIP